MKHVYLHFESLYATAAVKGDASLFSKPRILMLGDWDSIAQVPSLSREELHKT